MIDDLVLLDLCSASYVEPLVVDTGSVHVLVKSIDGATVIIFRGTASPLDWIRNVSVAPVSEPGIGMVHSGFMNGVNSVWAKIPAAGEIVITGHSKGGAEAKLLAAKFAAGGRPPVKLTTFGAPRVCWFTNGRLAELLAGVAGVDYRNCDDPVPNVPANYHHPREIVQLGKQFQDKQIIEDHFLDAYRHSLSP